MTGTFDDLMRQVLLINAVLSRADMSVRQELLDLLCCGRDRDKRTAASINRLLVRFERAAKKADRRNR